MKYGAEVIYYANSKVLLISLKINVKYFQQRWLENNNKKNNGDIFKLV